jgi:3-oxoacyl-[acyl-carrier-protein] synthase II
MDDDRDILVTGLGVVSPIGINVAEFVASIESNQSGIRLWQSPLLTKQFPAGVIEQDFASNFSKLQLPYLDRCSQLALIAAQQATKDAGLEAFGDYGPRAGLYYGSVTGSIKTQHDWLEQFYTEHKQNSKPFTIMASMLNSAPSHISIKHQILGPVMTHSSACSSSGAAIGDAMRAIRDGYLDVALVGGAESALTPAFMASWAGLRALAEIDSEDVSRSSKPFSSQRTGLVLGEGAVFMLLESRQHAQARGVQPYARLSGYGIASDGHHIGSPASSGQIAALKLALDDAKLAAADIAYMNAHATATPGGDPIETHSINAVFDRVPVSSTKAIHGHLLGAASAIELAVSILAVNHDLFPATAHLDDIDVKCDLNHIAVVPRAAANIQHAISLSAGFGGTNVALVTSKENKSSRRLT